MSKALKLIILFPLLNTSVAVLPMSATMASITTITARYMLWWLS
ncbi:unnamed protein product [Medioppia subpectinata]|uniref:NADH dehydrogenase subunit 2 n=1 Tax=Medioppia subpectinata TaxID=1979941 RepID=A0A7R9LZQ1_9ACAR|nr:unnamed protein product [Medioppia subpectinata]CAG2123054.1 unnamed protein product [Medioppia subpectinata]